jgi:very-short-patch-repair endonuclease
MTKQILFPLIIIFAAAVVSALLRSGKSRRKEGTFRARKLLTDNELEFFDRLTQALPDHHIFPQVAMSGLLESTSAEKKQAHSDHLRIAQQRTDYVVCDGRCSVLAVVELDDRTHSRVKDDVRDARLKHAGIRTVRFQSKNKPNFDAIRAAVLLTSPEDSASIAKV